MELSQLHKKVLELRAKKKIKEAEIELKHQELNSISDELFEAEWVKFTWSELENWLKANRPENKYEENPVVRDRIGRSMYCFLTEKQELQIGAYYHNDIFPRGCDLYVAYDFRKWR